jgi:hypothetical protein
MFGRPAGLDGRLLRRGPAHFHEKRLQELKHYIALCLIAVCGLSAADPAQTWETAEIVLPEAITDGLIDDLNNDGRKDLLLIAGNFINIFYNKKGGFSAVPDERFYYKLLGEYIDVGEVDPSSPGLELLGFSDEGVKCFKAIDSHYVESPGFVISTKIDMPEYRMGPVVSDFAFDINADGKDEILLLRGRKAFFYHTDVSGHWVPEAVESPANVSTVSIEDKARTSAGLLLQPSALSKASALFQDFNGDGLMDLASVGLRLQEREFRFRAIDSPWMDRDAAAGWERHRFFLDVDGDGSLDLIFLKAKDTYAENVNLFPVAKIFIHLWKDGGFSPTPNYFFKTIIVNGQAPFVDVDGDGDLDFVSVWSEITPGSKENIIQLLLESTLIFSFRCYLYDRATGYSNTPEINIKANIKGDFSYLSRELPFDLGADVDGDGSHDLLIYKDPESVLLYDLDFKAKNKIKSVKLIKVPGGFQGYRFSDLDGNGKSDIIFIKDKAVRIFNLADK